MRQDLPPASQYLRGAEDSNGEATPPRMYGRHGIRLGDVRIRRSREQRRGALQALRSVVGSIRRAMPFG